MVPFPAVPTEPGILLYAGGQRKPVDAAAGGSTTSARIARLSPSPPSKQQPAHLGASEHLVGDRRPWRPSLEDGGDHRANRRRHRLLVRGLEPGHPVVQRRRRPHAARS
jgi:hypothetical protein